MYMIGICDGEVKVCDAIKETVLKYGKENKLVFKISIYYSGEELELADKILRKNKTAFEYWKGHVCF